MSPTRTPCRSPLPTACSKCTVPMRWVPVGCSVTARSERFWRRVCKFQTYGLLIPAGNMSERSATPKFMTEKQQAHALIERLGPRQLTAVVGLLESMLLGSMLDPVTHVVVKASHPAD